MINKLNYKQNLLVFIISISIAILNANENLFNSIFNFVFLFGFLYFAFMIIGSVYLKMFIELYNYTILFPLFLIFLLAFKGAIQIFTINTMNFIFIFFSILFIFIKAFNERHVPNKKFNTTCIDVLANLFYIKNKLNIDDIELKTLTLGDYEDYKNFALTMIKEDSNKERFWVSRYDSNGKELGKFFLLGFIEGSYKHVYKVNSNLFDNFKDYIEFDPNNLNNEKQLKIKEILTMKEQYEKLKKYR